MSPSLLVLGWSRFLLVSVVVGSKIGDRRLPYLDNKSHLESSRHRYCQVWSPNRDHKDSSMGRAIPQAQHVLSFLRSLMSRRASSSTPPTSPKPAKRQRIEHLTAESFKNGVMLAPMVRSGACMWLLLLLKGITHLENHLVPTRLYALKHGAKLVWSPEVVDKAILHTERVVDRKLFLKHSRTS